jgi:hypothetical protein
MKELSMASYIKNGDAIVIPSTGVIDFEIALGTERMNQQKRLIQNILVGFGLACFVQITDLSNLFGSPMIPLEFESMGFHLCHLRLIYFVAINGK